MPTLREIYGPQFYPESKPVPGTRFDIHGEQRVSRKATRGTRIVHLACDDAAPDSGAACGMALGADKWKVDHVIEKSQEFFSRAHHSQGEKIIHCQFCRKSMSAFRYTLHRYWHDLRVFHLLDPGRSGAASMAACGSSLGDDELGGHHVAVPGVEFERRTENLANCLICRVCWTLWDDDLDALPRESALKTIPDRMVAAPAECVIEVSDEVMGDHPCLAAARARWGVALVVSPAGPVPVPD